MRQAKASGLEGHECRTSGPPLLPHQSCFLRVHEARSSQAIRDKSEDQDSGHIHVPLLSPPWLVALTGPEGDLHSLQIPCFHHPTSASSASSSRVSGGPNLRLLCVSVTLVYSHVPPPPQTVLRNTPETMCLQIHIVFPKPSFNDPYSTLSFNSSNCSTLVIRASPIGPLKF